MNWTYVAVASALPVIVGWLAAWPLWKRRVTDEMGSVVGAGLVLVFVVFFVAREFGEVQQQLARCQAEGHLCRFSPEPFTRYALYGGIGMAQVFAIFVSGLVIEERLRRRPQRGVKTIS